MINRVFLLFAFAYFLSEFYRSANTVLALDLAGELQLTPAQLGLSGSLLFAAFGLVQLPLGIGLDRWGARWVTSALMLVGALGSVLVANANSFGSLALGRILIGLGISGILMGAFKAFRQAFAPQHYTVASTLLVAIGSLGSLLAASPLAWLNGQVGWRNIFLVSSGLLVVAALSMMRWLPEQPAHQQDKSTAKSVGSLATILQHIDFWRISLLLFVINGAQMAFQSLWAGPYLQDIFQLQAVAAGNVVFLLSLGATIGFLTCGWLGERWGVVPVIVVGAGVGILCLFLLAWQPSLAVVRLIYLLLGMATGTAILSFAQVSRLFPSELTGRATSLANLANFLGIFVIQWLFGVLLNRFAPLATHSYPPQAYTLALAGAGVISFLALLWYLPVGNKK